MRRSSASSCSGFSTLSRLGGFEQTLADDERQRRQHGTAQGGIAFCASLALEWGIRYEREYIDWARQARNRIAEGAEGWDDTRERHLEQHNTPAKPGHISVPDGVETPDAGLRT
jgi:hypothetical protein